MQTDCESSWSGRTHWTDDSVDLRTRFDQVDENGIARDNHLLVTGRIAGHNLEINAWRKGPPAPARRRSPCWEAAALGVAVLACWTRSLAAATGCHGPLGLSLHSIVMGSSEKFLSAAFHWMTSVSELFGSPTGGNRSSCGGSHIHHDSQVRSIASGRFAFAEPRATDGHHAEAVCSFRLRVSRHAQVYTNTRSLTVALTPLQPRAAIVACHPEIDAADSRWACVSTS